MMNETVLNELLIDVLNFSEEKWNTPNTYDANYSQVPKGPGIYLWYAYKDLSRYTDGQIVYIGSSKNLYQRKCAHNIKPLIERDYGYFRFYFKEIDCDYVGLEKELIKAIKPKYNLQHTRG